MVTEINEKIKVMAVFEDAKLKPARFRWKGELYDVKDVTFEWLTKEGEEDIMHFNVTDGVNLFELSYNKNSLKWDLCNVDQQP